MKALDIILPTISFCAGMLVHYLTAYNKKKGENKALLEDVSKLEEEKQKIITKHSKEIEELKKEQTLDIERRKKNNELKYELYTQFLTQVDEFQRKRFTFYSPNLNNFEKTFEDLLIHSPEDIDGLHNKIQEYFTLQEKVYRNAINDRALLSQHSNKILIVASPKVISEFNTLSEISKKSDFLSKSVLDQITSEEYYRYFVEAKEFEAFTRLKDKKGLSSAIEVFKTPPILPSKPTLLPSISNEFTLLGDALQSYDNQLGKLIKALRDDFQQY